MVIFMEKFVGLNLRFDSENRTLVCKLQKALHSLKQAPKGIVSKVFKGYQALYSVSVIHLCSSRFTGAKFTYILLYVDDIIVTGSSTFLQHLVRNLNSEFSLKNLGNLHCFLGTEVQKFPDGSMHLFQPKYIRDLLHKTETDKAKGIQTQLPSGLKLSK